MLRLSVIAVDEAGRGAGVGAAMAELVLLAALGLGFLVLGVAVVLEERGGGVVEEEARKS